MVAALTAIPQLVALTRSGPRSAWAAVQIVAAFGLALPGIPLPPSIASAVVCMAAGLLSAWLLVNGFSSRPTTSDGLVDGMIL